MTQWWNPKAGDTKVIIASPSPGYSYQTHWIERPMLHLNFRDKGFMKRVEKLSEKGECWLCDSADAGMAIANCIRLLHRVKADTWFSGICAAHEVEVAAIMLKTQGGHL